MNNQLGKEKKKYDQRDQTIYGHQLNIGGNVGDNIKIELPPIEPTPATAPAPPPDFVGRTDHLAQLTATLAAGKSAAITALQGMGGIGKTALALQLANQLKPDFPGGIFWADLVLHNGSGKPILCQWGAICGADLSQEPDPNVLVERVRGLLARRCDQDGAILAVMDDVRSEPEAWMAAAILLKKCLPAGTPLLLTTREDRVATSLATEIQRLDLLPLADARTLLSERVKNDALLQPEETADRLLDALGYLPLAIRLAAGYLDSRGRKPGFDLATFVEQVARSAATMLDTPTAGLAATFQITYDALSEVQQQVFRYCSIYSAPLLTVEHMAGLVGMDETKVEDVLDALVDVALLDWDSSTTGRYLLHPLLRQYGYTMLLEHENVIEAHLRAAQLLHAKARNPNNKITPAELFDEVSHWEKSQQWDKMAVRAGNLVNTLLPYGYWTEIEHFLSIAQTHIENDKSSIRLYAEILGDRGIIAYHQGRWNDAAALQEKALELYSEMDNSHGIAKSLGNLGIVYKAKGNWAEAATLYERSLPLLHEIQDIAGLAKTYANLANIFQLQGEWQQAIGLYDRALSFGRATNNRRLLAQNYNNQGILHHALGEWDRAIELHSQALDITKDEVDKHGLAQTYNYLGVVFQAKAQFETAFTHFQNALQYFNDLGDLNGVAEAVGNIGSLLEAQQQWEKAEIQFQEALSMFRQIGNIRSEAGILNSMGNIESARNNLDAAGQYYEQAYNLFDGLQDPSGLALTLNDLGFLCIKQDELTEAIRYFQASIEIKSKLSDRKGLAITYINIGDAYWKQQRLDDALTSYARAQEEYRHLEHILGQARIFYKLGSLYIAKNNGQMASKYLELAIEKFHQLNDLKTMSRIRNELGSLYQDIGQFDKARMLHQHSYQGYKALDDKDGLASASSNLGNTLYCLGEVDSAGKYLRQGREIFDELDNKNGLANALVGLGNVHQAKEEWNEAIECYLQAEENYELIGNNEMSGTVQGNIGNVLLQSGKIDEAYARYQMALKISEQSGNRHDIARANGNLGTYFYALGNIEKATHYVAIAYIVFKEIGAFEASYAMDHLNHMLGSTDATERYLKQVKQTVSDNEV